MVRWLGLALYAEGRDDYLFLVPLLRRLCAEECSMGGGGVVEISEVYCLVDKPASKSKHRDQRIGDAAYDARNAWHILFIHADADRSTIDNAYHDRVQPGVEEVVRLLPERKGCCCPVIPIRNTDAWKLADGDALRRVFGSTRDDAFLSLLANAGDVEHITDPKAEFNRVCQLLADSRRPVKPAEYLALLAEEIALQRLDAIESFRKLRRDCVAALRTLSIIDA